MFSVMSGYSAMSGLSLYCFPISTHKYTGHQTKWAKPYQHNTQHMLITQISHVPSLNLEFLDEDGQNIILIDS